MLEAFRVADVPIPWRHPTLTPEIVEHLLSTVASMRVLRDWNRSCKWELCRAHADLEGVLDWFSTEWLCDAERMEPVVKLLQRVLTSWPKVSQSLFPDEAMASAPPMQLRPW